jgi:ribose/xylose/arabinose/galactoside ABC-type transport system permease subunit
MEEHIEQINDFTILGLSLPFFVALIVVVVGQLVLTGTVFGRYLIALGTNEGGGSPFRH